MGGSAHDRLISVQLVESLRFIDDVITLLDVPLRLVLLRVEVRHDILDFLDVRMGHIPERSSAVSGPLQEPYLR